ncbi:hypothetical protein E3Q16_03478 [Wallemia mellicola]|nr:hypothetical protein E3Q16_03478 [Wallemia mellicola]
MTVKRRSTIAGYEFHFVRDMVSIPLNSKSTSTTTTNTTASQSFSCISTIHTELSSKSSTSTNRSLSLVDKSVIRKYHILLELISTERQYYNDLRILVEVFLHNLPKSLSYPTRNLIKRNISSILALHSRITTSLDKVLEEEQTHLDKFFIGAGSSQHKSIIDRCTNKVANAFIDQAPYFDMYNEFCAQHSRALSKLSASNNLPIWPNYERRCFLQSQQYKPQNNKLQLKDYLIKPIQRVCRYPLVLDSLAKSSSDEDTRVEKALDMMKVVAEKADQARLEAQQQEKSELVAARCEGHSELSASEILSFGMTKLIGALDVFVHNSKLPLVPPLKVKYLGAFLYERFLVLVKIRKSTMYEPRYWFPLDLWHVTDVPSGEAGLMQNSFRMSLHTQHFEFSCCSEQEKEIWMKSIINSISISRKLWSQDYASAMTTGNSNNIKMLPTNVPYSLAHRKVAAPPASATAEDVEESATQFNQHFKLLARKRNSLPITTDLMNNMETTPPPQESPTPAMSFHYNLLPPPETAPSINKSSSTKFVYHNGNPAEPLVLRRSPSAPRAAVDRCMASILSEELSQARYMAALNLPSRNQVRPRKVRSVHADLNALANEQKGPSHKKPDVKRRRSFVYLDTTDETNNSFGDIFDDQPDQSKKKSPSRITEIYGRKRKTSGTLGGSSSSDAIHNTDSSAALTPIDDHHSKSQIYKNRRKLGHSFSSKFSSFGDSIKSFTPTTHHGNSPLSTPTAIYATEKAPIPKADDHGFTERKRNKSFSGLKSTLRGSTSEQNLWQASQSSAKKPLTETEALYIKYLQGDIGPPDESPEEQDKAPKRPNVLRSVTYSHPESTSSGAAETSATPVRGRQSHQRIVSANTPESHKRTRSRSRFTNLITSHKQRHDDNEEVLRLSDLPTPQLELPNEVGRMSPLSKFFFHSDESHSSDSHVNKELPLPEMSRISSQQSRQSGSLEVNRPGMSRTSTEARVAGVPQLPKLRIGEDGTAQWKKDEIARTPDDFGPQNTAQPTSSKSSKHKSWSSASTPNLLSRLNSLSSTRSRRVKKEKVATQPSTPTTQNGEPTNTLNRKKSLKAFLTKMNFTKV